MEITRFISHLKDELVLRNVQKMSRPIKISLNYQEYRLRQSYAQSIEASKCYEITQLKKDSYLAINPPQREVESLINTSINKLKNTSIFKSKGPKKFFSNLLSQEDYDPTGIFIKFAINETILNTIAVYLGCVPFLQAIELLFSKPSDALPERSQLWHIDQADKSIIKVFVYIDDVSPKNGPLTFLPCEESRKVPWYVEHYLTDAQIEKYALLSRAIKFTGQAGAALMIDTKNLYHFGSRCSKPRLAYVADYTSGFGYYSRQRKHQKWSQKALSECNLSQIQKFALGLN